MYKEINFSISREVVYKGYKITLTSLDIVCFKSARSE